MEKAKVVSTIQEPCMHACINKEIPENSHNADNGSVFTHTVNQPIVQRKETCLNYQSLGT